jgi:hypothetical protein
MFRASWRFDRFRGSPATRLLLLLANQQRLPVPRGGGARALRSDDADAGGRRALGALADLELHALPLLEAAEARGVDFGVVDENVGAVAVLGDEAVALLPVERDRTLARGGSIWLLALNLGAVEGSGPTRPAKVSG